MCLCFEWEVTKYVGKYHLSSEVLVGKMLMVLHVEILAFVECLLMLRRMMGVQESLQRRTCTRDEVWS